MLRSGISGRLKLPENSPLYLIFTYTGETGDLSYPLNPIPKNLKSGILKK